MSNTTVLITGATNGIGYQTALVLASQGARVLVTGRDVEHGEAAVEAIRRQAGHERVEFLAADHSTVGANQELARQVRERLAGLDVLINNVGRVFPRREETADGYEATLALCFLGPVALTQELLPLLERGAHARIVNMASSAYKMWHGDPFEDVQSHERYIGIQAHARAKLFNIIWTVALAPAIAPLGVTVNAVNPGTAWTPGTQQLTPDAVPQWRHIWPVVRYFQRRNSPAKAARAPLWLVADPAAAQLNGAYLEKQKPRHPKVANDRENQQRTTALAEELIRTAPTATTG